MNYASTNIMATFTNKFNKLSKGHRASPLLPPIGASLKQTMYSSNNGPLKSSSGTLRSGSSIKNNKRVGK